MCKGCVSSQPWQILLGSTTVINTSANVASGTAWQHLARRTARPHLPCSRWISIRLKACGIEIPSEPVLVTLSFLWQNTWPQWCKGAGFIWVHGFRGTLVHWGSNSMTAGGAPSLEKTRIQKRPGWTSSSETYVQWLASASQTPPPNISTDFEIVL